MPSAVCALHGLARVLLTQARGLCGSRQVVRESAVSGCCTAKLFVVF